MARSFNPNDLIALPIVDADGAIALAKTLESATLDRRPAKAPHGMEIPLPSKETWKG